MLSLKVNCIASLARSGKRKMIFLRATLAHRVQRALQDEGSGHFIDGFRPFRPRGVRFQHRPRHRDGRETLILKIHRQVEQRLEVLLELANRLAARSLAAVHIDRQADDETADVPFLNNSYDFRRIRLEFCPLDCHKGRADLERGVGNGKADGFRARIHPEQAFVAGQQMFQMGGVVEEHRIR